MKKWSNQGIVHVAYQIYSKFGHSCRISFVRINPRRGRHECLTHQRAGQHGACLISATFCTSSDTCGKTMQSWFFKTFKYSNFFAESLPCHFGQISSINPCWEKGWGSIPIKTKVCKIRHRWRKLSSYPKKFTSLDFDWHLTWGWRSLMPDTRAFLSRLKSSSLYEWAN